MGGGFQAVCAGRGKRTGGKLGGAGSELLLTQSGVRRQVSEEAGVRSNKEGRRRQRPGVGELSRGLMNNTREGKEPRGEPQSH